MACRLFLAGDVMTGRGVDQILRHPAEPVLYEPHLTDARDYVRLAERASGPIPRGVGDDYVWGTALEELERARPDARIVNLETSVTADGSPVLEKGINYRMHPLNVGCLKAAKIDVCVLANNHVLDWNEIGLSDTLDALHGVGIQTAGAGRDEAEAQRPALVPAREARVVVFGIGHPSSGIPRWWSAASTRAGIWVVDELSSDIAEEIGERAQRSRQPGDLVVVSIHWGSNWGYGVSEAHAAFAHALVDAGVDVVHGHSSHHRRPIEVYRDKLILYGCGDLLSDYEGIGGHAEYRGDLPIVYLADCDPATGRLLELRMVPMRVRKMRLERASPAEVRWTRDELQRISRPFGTEVVAGGEALRLVTNGPAG